MAEEWVVDIGVRIVILTDSRHTDRSAEGRVVSTASCVSREKEYVTACKGGMERHAYETSLPVLSVCVVTILLPLRAPR